MGNWFFPISGNHYDTLGHALVSLNDDINEWETNFSERQHIINKIQYAYHYFHKTGRGTGLAELASILENAKTGWLWELFNNGKKGNYLSLDRLLGMDDVQEWGKRINNKYPIFAAILLKGEQRQWLEEWWSETKWVQRQEITIISGLYYFKDIRNKSVHGPNSRQQYDKQAKRIERAFYFFLVFAEAYLHDRHEKMALFGLPKHLKAADVGDIFCDRFKVLEVLGGDETSRTYKVQDQKGHSDQVYAVKRVSVFSKDYEDIINNETQSRPLFNDNQYVGRFYSSHDEVPIGTLLLLEYIDGWILQQWVQSRKGNRLNSHELYELIYVIGGILKALMEIHKKGYVHGNVDMRSILITRLTKEAKLVSFDKCTVANENFTARIDTFSVGKVLQSIIECYVKSELVTDGIREFIAKATADNLEKQYPDAASMYEDWLKIYNEVRYSIRPVQHVNKIALISCSNRKQPGPLPAEELYSASPNFRSALKAVMDISANYDAVHIVNGRYGLVDLRQELPAYDYDLRQLPKEKQSAWAENIATVLRVKYGDGTRHVTVFADDIYAKCLLTALAQEGFMAKRERGYF